MLLPKNYGPKKTQNWGQIFDSKKKLGPKNVWAEKDLSLKKTFQFLDSSLES